MKNKVILPANSKRTAQRRMPSGLMGSVSRLQARYVNFEEWENYSNLHGLSIKLGFANAQKAWAKNPIVQSSVSPSDYGIYKPIKST